MEPEHGDKVVHSIEPRHWLELRVFPPVYSKAPGPIPWGNAVIPSVSNPGLPDDNPVMD